MQITQENASHCTESDPFIVGKNLKLMRCVFEVSQKETADILHMSRTAYTALESGRRLPDFSTMCALSEFYQIPLGYLLNRNLSYEFFQFLQYGGDLTADSFLYNYNLLSHSAKLQIAHKITELFHPEQP